MGSDREFKVLITGDASGLKSSSKEAGAELQDLGQKGKQAHKDIGDEVDKLNVKHSDWRNIVRGLKTEFPEMAHLAHMALHPVTLTVFAITGAFWLWQKRAESLARVLTQVILPDIKIDTIGHINANTEAWEKYGAAVAKTNEQLSSVSATSARISENMARELALELELIKATHDYASAKLEAMKAAMSEAEYRKKKLDLEQDAGAATAETQKQAGRDAFAGKVIDVLDLREEAKNKKTEASGIKIASKEDDAKTLEDLTKQKEAAEKDLEGRETRIAKFYGEKDGSGSYMDSLWVKAQQFYTGMSVDQMIALEQQGAETDRIVIGRQNKFRSNLPGRDRARGRRESLLAGAAEDESKAAGIEAGLGDQEIGMHKQEAASRTEQTLSALAEAYRMIAQVNEHALKLQEEIAKSIQSTGGYATATYAQLQEQLELLKMLEARVKALEDPAQRANHL